MTPLISWSVPPSEWNDAAEIARRERPGSYFDRRRIAADNMLNGTVQFQCGGQVLFPPEGLLKQSEQTRALHIEQGDPWFPLPNVSEIHGWTMSLVDLAYQLVEIRAALCDQCWQVESAYREESGPRVITFNRSDENVRISVFSEWIITVPVAEFCTGVRDFLIEFTAALAERVPQLLEWETFDRFRPFLFGEP